MPKIEIVPLRFNLDKDDDRKIFEELAKRTEPGKRNEFIKQMLSEFFTVDSAGGKPASRAGKKVENVPARPLDVKKPIDGPLSEAPVASDRPVAQEPLVTSAEEDQGGNQKSDSEVPSLVSQFVQ